MVNHWTEDRSLRQWFSNKPDGYTQLFLLTQCTFPPFSWWDMENLDCADCGRENSLLWFQILDADTCISYYTQIIMKTSKWKCSYLFVTFIVSEQSPKCKSFNHLKNKACFCSLLLKQWKKHVMLVPVGEKGRCVFSTCLCVWAHKDLCYKVKFSKHQSGKILLVMKALMARPKGKLLAIPAFFSCTFFCYQ